MRHSPEELAALGLVAFAGSQSTPKPAERVEERGEPSARQTLPTLVQPGPGLAAIPRKSKPTAQAAEGQIILVQAADLAPTWKLVSDLTTWLQCFALYAAAVNQNQPERMAEMMAYQTIIAKASQRYRWPSWAIYDNTFRQEMAGTTGQSWARVDPSIYSLCFTGQAIGESWCGTCQTLDHTPQTCPVRRAKRPWNMAFGGQQSQAVSSKGETCRRFNRNAGDCRFGKECC